MKTSDAGLAALTKREGKKNEAYLDVKGIPTIGVGHTSPEVHIGLVWTDQQVQDALRADVEDAEDCVNGYVKAPLTQYQFDALVSFVFNVGDTAFRRSTLLQVLNTGDYAKAAECFMMWNKPAAIIGRRISERRQFENI